MSSDQNPELEALRDDCITVAGLLCQEDADNAFLAQALGRMIIRINTAHQVVRKAVGSKSYAVSADDFDRNAPRAALLEKLLLETPRKRGGGSSKRVALPAQWAAQDDQAVNDLRERVDALRAGLEAIVERAQDELACSKDRVEHQPVHKTKRVRSGGTTTAEKFSPETGVPGLKAGAVRMLQCLATFYPGTMTQSQVATATKMKVTGGTFLQYWGVLKRYGLIEERDKSQYIATKVGLAALGASRPEIPKSLDARVDFWNDRLKAGARDMLAAVLEAGVEGITKPALAHNVNMTETGGTFNAYLSTLRVNKLIGVAGNRVYVHPWLKGEG